MKFAENEVRQITEETWQIVLGEELQGSRTRFAPGQIKNCLAACAQITGDWQLAVVLYCSSDVARNTAAVMFGAEEAQVSNEDVRDALCELISIIAGNIKGVLSGSSHVSLANLVKGQDFNLMFPCDVLLSDVQFIYRGEPLLVMLLGHDKTQSGEQTPYYNGVAEEGAKN
jgi:CheY-specific phosphatase CheX